MTVADPLASRAEALPVALTAGDELRFAAPRHRLAIVRHAAGVGAGGVVLAVGDAVARTVWGPRPASIGLFVAVQAFDAAETIGLWVLAGLAFALLARLTRAGGSIAVVAGALVCAPIVALAMGDRLRWLAAATLGGRHLAPLTLAYGVLAAFAAPIAYAVGSWTSRRAGLCVATVSVALAGIILDQVVQRDGYFGIHGVYAWVAATLGGAALGPAAERAIRWVSRRPAARVAFAVMTVLGVGVAPPNAVRVELFRLPASVAQWALATVLWRSPRPRTPATPSPWLEDRAARPALPPSVPSLLPESPVVVLVTIDATRADVVNDPANDALLPTLAALKRAGAVFTHATAPASQTVLSLASVFSGRYASQLSWAFEGQGTRRHSFPAVDPSPRFPALLSRSAVDTFHEASIAFLGEDYGVVEGFSEAGVLAKGAAHVPASVLVPRLVARLKNADAAPLFAYAHMTEPHAPYDRGRKDGSDYDRYLSEVAVADRFLAEVVTALQPLGDRWVLIVSADHGESFGTHGTYHHGETLYQEVLHVPLVVAGPRIAPRVVEQRVDLVDLGPTILDLFGVATPGTYMGQSLVPLLAGRKTDLTRPILAEGKLRRSLTDASGFEVIDDPRRKTVEAYDLAVDPAETRNLFGEQPARADAALATLRAYVATQSRGGEYRQDGEL